MTRPTYRTEVALCPVLIRGSGSCAADNRGSGRCMFSPTMVDAKRSAVAEALLPTVVAFALHELLRLFLLQRVAATIVATTAATVIVVRVEFVPFAAVRGRTR